MEEQRFVIIAVSCKVVVTLVVGAVYGKIGRIGCIYIQ